MIPLAARSARHFVISNYNTDPTPLIAYSDSYTLFDQSTDESVRQLVLGRYPGAIQVVNPGHSLANFMSFIADNHEGLPRTTLLLKSNIIGRHVTREYFESRFTNTYYTPLFYDPGLRPRAQVISQVGDGLVIEVNNAWYVDSSTDSYFRTFNELLHFIYQDAVQPEWVAFAPGGCYVVPRENLEHLPASLLRGLAWLTSYQYFPPEAYLLERLLHTLFTTSYALQPWAYDLDDFVGRVEARGLRSGAAPSSPRLNRLRRAVQAGAAQFRHGG